MSKLVNDASGVLLRDVSDIWKSNVWSVGVLPLTVRAAQEATQS